MPAIRLSAMLFRCAIRPAAVLLTCITVGHATAQLSEDQGLVLLARTYKQSMFGSEPTKEVLTRLKTEVPPALAKSRDFIVQTITPKNDLLDAAYLTIPEETVLRQIGAVRALFIDMDEEERVGDQPLLDNLRNTPMPRTRLVRDYYAMLFTAVGNKNRPFNLSKLDLRPDSYGLKDDTEKGILFLECMDLCRSTIWGYVNIPKPPNTKEALAHIKRYPKANGTPYYQYMDLKFADFQFMYDDSLQSYKGVMVDQYLNLLIMHLMVLDAEGADKETIHALMLGSALRDEKLYHYSKDRAILERLFQKQ